MNLITFSKRCIAEILFVALFMYSGQATATPAARPNVLLISIDDLNDWVGCLGGHPQTKTPHIDKLASQGTLFTRAYCAAPSCNPSRTATLTGLAPWVSGVYRNGQKWREVLPNAVTLPQYFKQQGYYCAGAGKIFHHYQNDAASWHKYFPSIKNGFPPNPRAPKANQPAIIPWKGYYGEFTWGPQAADVGDEQTGDFQSVQFVIKQLQTLPQDKPFFLNCGIYRPHVPWFVPQKYFDRFPLDQTKLPEQRADDLADLPETILRRQLRSRYYAELDRLNAHRDAVRAYLASINYMDEMVGKVLAALKQSNHHDNSIVVFWSDHGFHLSEKHWYRKYSLWDDSCHVPLIVRLPRSLQKGQAGQAEKDKNDGKIAWQQATGQSCERAVGLLDLYPTLVELAGLPPRKELSGQSFAPLLVKPDGERKTPVITVDDWEKDYAVRTEKWCYIYRPDGEELYDQVKDPHQFFNLAKQPRHAKTLAMLRKHVPTDAVPAGKPRVGG